MGPAPLGRRALAEALGTALLVAVVVGSGIAAQQLSPTDVGLQLAENALATAAGLFAIIRTIGPVSGAHLNPVVSIAAVLLGALDRRAGRTDTGGGLRGADLLGYLPAQLLGAVGGCVLANLLFALPAATASTTTRSAGHLRLSEVVATAGLLLVVFSLTRSGRGEQAPAAVGAYIGAAYFFTSSTSFANPAVTLGRAFTDTFAGIAPHSLAGYLLAQALGLAVALGLIVLLHPDPVARGDQVPLTARPRPGDPPTSHGPTSEPAAAAGSPDAPQVLFVCVHNAGRSQMAAALLTHHAGDRVRVRSAGSAPADTLDPAVVQAMAEIGLDITGQRPKQLEVDAVQDSDVVITMGCGDTCPIFPGRTYLDWVLDDPAGQPLNVVRRIRDEIDRHVQDLLRQLTS